MKIHSTVRNLITNETLTYYNGCDLETNLISAIAYQKGYTVFQEYSRTLIREKIAEMAKIGRIPTLDGSEKVYSPTYDMIAYHTTLD